MYNEIQPSICEHPFLYEIGMKRLIRWNNWNKSVHKIYAIGLKFYLYIHCSHIENIMREVLKLNRFTIP